MQLLKRRASAMRPEPYGACSGVGRSGSQFRRVARLTESKKIAAPRGAPIFLLSVRKRATKFRSRGREKYGRVYEDLVALLCPLQPGETGCPSGPRSQSGNVKHSAAGNNHEIHQL